MKPGSIRKLWLLGMIGFLVSDTPSLPGQFDPATVEKKTLAWRTALHFDPLSKAPLEMLLRFYGESNRLEELLQIYTKHLGQYPDDVSAKVVLARLYIESKNPIAKTFIDNAMEQHPESSLLAITHVRYLQSVRAADVVKQLDRAIALETDPVRRAPWIDELLQLASQGKNEDIVTARFHHLASKDDVTPQQRLRWATQCLETGFFNAAQAVLTSESLNTLQGDDAVQLGFTRAQIALGKCDKKEASRLVTDLLSKLAVDHWRYREALTLRWQLTSDPAEKKALLGDAEKKWKEAPASETNALTYGDLLMTADKRKEAIKVWRETLMQLSESQILEERIIGLLEQMQQADELLAFLAERVRQQPQRYDIALKQAHFLLTSDKPKEGMDALNRLLDQTDDSTRKSLVMQTARWLRTRNAFVVTAEVLEAQLKKSPQEWDIRKELAEVYLLLKLPDDIPALFDVPIAETVSDDVRMEVALFLANRKLWVQCRKLLEPWVAKKASEFDGRLLLAKVNRLLGSHAEADRLLKECRSLCDTEARYGAWLNMAWEDANEREQTEAFIKAEREIIQPPEGKAWDANRLAQLLLLSQQTFHPDDLPEVEKLLRQALSESGVSPEQRHKLRLQLIQLLQNQPNTKDQPKLVLELEKQYLAAIKEAGAVKGDLQLGLAMMYEDSERSDLAQKVFAELDITSCNNVMLLIRAANTEGFKQWKQALLERLIHLQPDERYHWIRLLALPRFMKNEPQLRQKLRELMIQSRKWNLSDDQKVALEKHLTASYWRSIGTQWALDRNHEITLTLLDEMERTGIAPHHRLWASFIRGLIGNKLGNQEAVSIAREVLDSAKTEWVDFPDGLSVSMEAAQDMLNGIGNGIDSSTKEGIPTGTKPPLPPFELNWVFQARQDADFQRWDLTPDGKSILISDSQQRLFLLSRETGKMRWQGRIPFTQETANLNVNARPTPIMDRLIEPPEWVMTPESVCIAHDGTVYSLSLHNGEIQWQFSSGFEGNNLYLAQKPGHILVWNFIAGRLSALDESTGKLVWNKEMPELSNLPKTNDQNAYPWFPAGIGVANGRILLWGTGTALLRDSDGKVLWKALAHGANEPPGFPPDLTDRTNLNPAIIAQDVPIILSWDSAFLDDVPDYSIRYVLTNPVYTLPNPLKAMYGNYPVWIPGPWGYLQTKLLSRDTIWRIAPSGAREYSLLGLPLMSSRSMGESMHIGAVSYLGSYGRTVVTTTDHAIMAFNSAAESRHLWVPKRESTDGSSSSSFRPTGVIHGRTLMAAWNNELHIQDVISGTVLWHGACPEEMNPYIKSPLKTQTPFVEGRLCARGLVYKDSKDRSLVINWKALCAEADFIFPTNTKTLINLRGQTDH